MKLFKVKSIVLIVVFAYVISVAQGQMQTFPLSSVKITEGPFYKAMMADLEYILAMDEDRLLAPYLIDAGIKPLAERYPNWENTGLDGHIGGHYLTALAQMYVVTEDPDLFERLNYMVDWLDKCQQKNGDGYIGGVPGGHEMWKEIAEGNIVVDNFGLNKKWVPWYNLHKLYAGLRDAYQIAGIEKAKQMLIDLSDWTIELTKNLSDEQMQKMLQCEHGGMNEVFADVYAMTGDKKYLDLAERFSHHLLLDPLLEKENKLTHMHANTQIPKVVGFKRIADEEDNKEWNDASRFFWETVIDNWTISIGGNSVSEHFHKADDFEPMVTSVEGPETCNSYNMLKLSKLLFLSENDKENYMNYYERIMFNHILSSQNPDKGGFVYFTPMRPQHYRVYSQPNQCFWCCVGSGLENHSKYGELIYSHDKNDLYVNMFIPSTLDWEENGVEIIQETKFPYEENTQLTFKLKKASKFPVKIRYPEWIDTEKGIKAKVNGENYELGTASDGYFTIERKWNDGDVISLELPMSVSIEYLPDNSPWASVKMGPVIMAAVTDSNNLDGLFADDKRFAHIANGSKYPIDEAPVIITEKHDFSDKIERIADKPMALKLIADMYPEDKAEIQLVPFYEVHEARYMVYFPVASQAELDAKIEELKKKEAERIALEKITIDKVATGEQQPESDHNFKGEGIEAGVYLDEHWRHAIDWFSYDLKDPKNEAKTLRLTYCGLDAGRTFDILLNDELLETVSLKGEAGPQLIDVDYKIPEEIVEKNAGGKMILKFKAHPENIAGGIYYVRLLRE